MRLGRAQRRNVWLMRGGRAEVAGAYPRVIVECAFGCGPNDPPVWTDLTPLVRGPIEIDSGGREDVLGESVSGGGSVRLGNRAGALDPRNPASPYAGRLVPNVPVRVRALWGAESYPLAYGFVEGWQPQTPHAGLDAELTVRWEDRLALLARVTVPDGLSRPAETGDQRIAAVLTACGVPAWAYSLEPGYAQLQAQTITGPARTHLVEVAASEGGTIWQDASGILRFASRYHRAVYETAPRATFGDGGGDELPYRDILPSQDNASLYTEVVVDATGGASVRVADSAAVASYGALTLTRSSLGDRPEAEAQAEWLLARHRAPAVRFAAVELLGVRRPSALWPLLLAAEHGQRYRFRQRPLGVGLVEEDGYIERVEHRITPSDWVCRWQLAPYGDDLLWVLGVGVLGTTTYLTW